MSPWPSSASAPPWSRMTLLSTCEDTAKAIRAGMLTLIVPVMMSVEGRWVASSRWIPTPGPGAVELGEVPRPRLPHDPVAALHLGDQVVEDVRGQPRRGDHRG